MKRQDIAKLHHETRKELTDRLITLQKSLVDSRMQIRLGKEKNRKKMTTIRTDIARIKTIMSTIKEATKTK